VERALSLGLDAIHPHFLIPEKGITAARNSGLQVNVYTVNFPFLMKALLNMGVTSIITDQPGVLREVIEENKAKQ